MLPLLQPPWTFGYQHPSIRQECEAPGVVEAMRDHRHPDHAVLGAEVLSGLADRGALRQGCGRIAGSPKDRDDKQGNNRLHDNFHQSFD